MNIEVGSAIIVARPGKLFGYYGKVAAIIGNNITVSFGQYLGNHQFLKSELNVLVSMNIKPHKNYPEW